jgi:tetratricopeptide (TPR) repeat protein
LQTPGAEDWLLSHESDISAFFGRLKKAREFSQQAIDAAVHNDEKDGAALWQMNSAIQEAEFGYPARAQRETLAALKIASTRDVRVLAALVLARSGDSVGAEKMTDDLARQFPLNTVVQSYWLPTIRAAIEINLGQGDKAIESLGRAHDCELGGPNPELESGRFLYPSFVRGYAFLRARNGREAESEFGTIVQHPALIQNCPLGALARLGLARALAMQGDREKARASYEEFFTLWKDADADIPELKKAKSEYLKLH